MYLKGLKAVLNKSIVRDTLNITFIGALGDTLAQLFANGSFRDFDIKRTLQFSGMAFFFVGPVASIWINKLETLVSQDQAPITRGFKKMIIDQGVFSPIMLGAVIALYGKLNSESNKEVAERLNKDYIPLLLDNYKLWPIVQIINFTVMPLKYQILFPQIIGVFWNIYICYLYL